MRITRFIQPGPGMTVEELKGAAALMGGWDSRHTLPLVVLIITSPVSTLKSMLRISTSGRTSSHVTTGADATRELTARPPQAGASMRV
jgi:hypothetical protein